MCTCNSTYTLSGSTFVCTVCGTPFVGTPRGTGVPNPTTKCGTIWGVCTKLYTLTGGVPTRGMVLGVCTPPAPKGLGLNYHTVVTQYQRWVTHNGYNTQKGMVTPTLTQLGMG